LQLSCAGVGFPLAVQALKLLTTHVSGKVTISGVSSIEPDESRRTVERPGASAWAAVANAMPTTSSAAARRAVAHRVRMTPLSRKVRSLEASIPAGSGPVKVPPHVDSAGCGR
jgi:hypothetical protein